ncbi:hypothetical protein KEM54_004052, partial [Ascosphaera aggregata]
MPPQPPTQAHLHACPSNTDLNDDTGFNPLLLSGSYTFCAFDNVPSASRAKLGGKVLLVGRDGSLEVLALNTDKPNIIGRIEGLNGRVVDAKVMTWSSHTDPFALFRPLVAIVLHGQLPPTTAEGDALGHETTPCDNMSGISPIASADLPLMQTSVQVYSLRTQKLLTTLYYTRPVSCYYTIPGHPITVPGPCGQLSLHISGNYLLVASGISGEIYVFTAKFLEPAVNDGPTFQCLGKYWASTLTRIVDSRRQSYSSSSKTADVDDGCDVERAYQVELPLLSLSGRYLAVVSPSLSNKVSIQGTVPQSLIARGARGLNAYTPPARPSVTCVTDEEQAESLLNKMARGFTQEL